MITPRLLDLFSGAGGAARGYQMAGFEVVGVDIVDQPRYIGEHFAQGDAIAVLVGLKEGKAFRDRDGCDWRLEDFAAIHASPPCQGYSIMNNLPWLRGREYPLLILPCIELLEGLGKPYVLENVMGARHGAKGLAKRGLEAHGLKAGWLCGRAFGRPFYRHRLFAADWLWLAPEHPRHRHRILPGRFMAGRARKAVSAGAMGIDWMKGKELFQAIPPCYTEFIGRQLMQQVVALKAKPLGEAP